MACPPCPLIVNLVEVELTAMCGAASATGVQFAERIIKDFDLVPAQVACVIGSDSRATFHVLTSGAHTAVRNSELQLTGCAFGNGGSVRNTVAQLARIVKYVSRDYRLLAGPLDCLPAGLLVHEDATARPPRPWGHPGRRLRRMYNKLLLLSFVCESRTPPRAHPPPRPRPSPLHLGLVTDCMPPAAALFSVDRNEALTVWLHVHKAFDTAYRTDCDLRCSVPGFNGWRVLCRMRRTGKGVGRLDLYVYGPWVLPHVPLESLRPTNQAVRSFAALKRFLAGQ